MAIPSKPSYTHGSTGSEPQSAIDYNDGDPVEAKHFDYYINTPLEKIKGVIDALNGLDSDDDGVVDKSDDAAALDGDSPPLSVSSLSPIDSSIVEFRADISGNRPGGGTAGRIFFETDNGRVLYDDGGSWKEVGLSESEISLSNLGSRSHSDLSSAPASAHHSRYTDEEAQDAVGAALSSELTYSDSSDSFGVNESYKFTWTDKHTWEDTIEFTGLTPKTGSDPPSLGGETVTVSSNSTKKVLAGGVRGFVVISEQNNNSSATFSVYGSDGANTLLVSDPDNIWSDTSGGGNYNLYGDSGTLTIGNPSSSGVTFDVNFVGVLSA